MITLQHTGLSWPARIAHYEAQVPFPKHLFMAGDGRCIGVMIMGNDYRVKSKFYGGYPAGYLRRMKALFPDKQKALHLFRGRVDTEFWPGDTVDIVPELQPTYLDDAQTLLNVPLALYDIVLVDPPYSVEDAVHYGTSMIKRRQVMTALQRLKPGTHVVWLDQAAVMYRKDFFRQDAAIGMQKSTNHRYRQITIFRRTKKEMP